MLPRVKDSLKKSVEDLARRPSRLVAPTVEAKASTSRVEGSDLDKWVKHMKDQADMMKEAYQLQAKSKNEVQRALSTLTIEYANMVEKQKYQSNAMEQIQVAYTQVSSKALIANEKIQAL